MSAHDQMRAMLDQLMGTARNGERDGPKVRFDDARVCKSFLLGCCPHDILATTRMDIGECPRIHDLALRADFANASRHRDYFYDIEATEHLQAFIADCDRRTDLAKRRLAETQEELSAEVAEKANKVMDLAKKIGEALARAEELGAEGLVEESMKLMEEIDSLRKQKSEAEEEYQNSMPAGSYQQQKLRVCEVCSAYLGIHDHDRRLADHFGGKLHLGFIKIREKLAELEKTVDARREARKEMEQKSDRKSEYSERNHRDRNRPDYSDRARDRDRSSYDRDRDYRRERERPKERRDSSRDRYEYKRRSDRRSRSKSHSSRSSRRSRSRSRSRSNKYKR